MNISKKILLASAVSQVVALSAYAAVPNTFTAGSPALASEVNENFTSLDGQITTLSTEVEQDFTSVEARIAALEEKVEQLMATPSYTDRLAGSTYSGQFIFFGYLGDDNGSLGFGTNQGSEVYQEENPHIMRFMKGGGSFSMTLNADGTVSNDMGSETEIESLLTTTCDYNEVTTGCNGFSSYAQEYSDEWNQAQSATTWSVDEATGVVSIMWDGEELENFQASADGSVIYALTFTNEVDENRQIENSVAIMVRQK